MANIIIYSETVYSEKFGEYVVEIVKPPAAKVTLIDHNAKASESLFQTVRAFKGVYDLSPEDDSYTLDNAIDDIINSKFRNQLEMIHTLWLLQGVTRAFTHQLVRYRVGTAFVQESMRFIGMKKKYQILATHSAELHEEYIDTAVSTVVSYVNLLEKGVAGVDARGILPTNILTSIFFDCSFATLQGLFPQRLCCQAQKTEWQPILLEMRRLIRDTMEDGDKLEKLLRAPYEMGKECGYRASFDRPCTWSKQ